MSLYRIREKFAYSRTGKLIATAIRNRWFPLARVHWVQQGIADGTFAKCVVPTQRHTNNT